MANWIRDVQERSVRVTDAWPPWMRKMAGLGHFDDPVEQEYQGAVEDSLNSLACRIANLTTGERMCGCLPIPPASGDRAYRYIRAMLLDGMLANRPPLYADESRGGIAVAEFSARYLRGQPLDIYFQIVFLEDGAMEMAATTLSDVETVVHPHDAWSAARAFRRFVDQAKSES